MAPTTTSRRPSPAASRMSPPRSDRPRPRLVRPVGRRLAWPPAPRRPRPVAAKPPPLAPPERLADRSCPGDRAPRRPIEALVDVAVSVLETGEPADDLERVLDAVGRFAGDRSEAFARLTAAIAKRARTILARRESSAVQRLRPAGGRRRCPARLGDGRARRTEPTSGVGDPGRRRVPVRPCPRGRRGGRGRPSVRGRRRADPRGGWIDPAVLVRRLAARPPASTLDLVAAILRLAPAARDARPARLAAGLAGEVGAAVRYALGGDEPIGPTAAWWVAAARVRRRARTTRRSSSATRASDRMPVWPLASEAAGRTIARPSFAARARDRAPAPAHTSVELPDRPDAPRPVVVLLDGRIRARDAPLDGHRPARLSRALGGDGFVARMASNIDWWSAAWANRAFLEPFIDPVTSIGPHARALIGIALGAKEAGERGLATDIVSLALADGRLTASALAEGLAAAAAVACDRPNRWAISLADVAAVSDATPPPSPRRSPVLPPWPIARAAKLVPLLRLLDELLAARARRLWRTLVCLSRRSRPRAVRLVAWRARSQRGSAHLKLIVV